MGLVAGIIFVNCVTPEPPPSRRLSKRELLESKLVFHNIAIGSDHGAFDMKADLISYLGEAFPSLRVTNTGCMKKESCDYPDIAQTLCAEIQTRRFDAGLLMDGGGGVAIAIAANKHEGIRCGVAFNEFTANSIREHNDANVMAFGPKTASFDEIKELVNIFLTTPFGGGRHARRTAKFKLVTRD